MKQLTPGCIGFSRIGGAAGKLVDRGQEWLADAIEDEKDIDHVYVVTAVGDGCVSIVQAMPSGAEEVRIYDARIEADAFLRPQYNPSQGVAVARCARRYIGVPYSFMDYAALAVLHTAPKWWRKVSPLRRYVTTSKRMICSQLADQALTDAGYHAFSDGRLPQDVMPVELYRQLLLQGAEIVL